jgi:hypothetical protein
MAGECSREGEICDNDGRAFPFEFIANQLNINLGLLTSTITKCEEDGRIVVKDGVIIIVNWKAYQSEYDRQKLYRGKEVDDTNPSRYKGQKYDHLVER